MPGCWRPDVKKRFEASILIAFSFAMIGLLDWVEDRVLVRAGLAELTKSDDRRLIRGMPVESTINTAERSPFDCYFGPLWAHFNRAPRES